jgi:O-antigen/teichoic acid export membrane protein
VWLGGNRLLAWRFRNPALRESLLWIAPYPLLLLPAAAIGACLMARDRPRQLAAYNVLSRLFVFAVVVAACWVWRTPGAAITATVLGTGLVLIPAIGLMFRACRTGEGGPSLSGMREQMAYSVPLGLSTMLMAVSRSLDKVIVASMCSAPVFAVYAVGAIEVLIPEFASLYRDGEHGKMLQLWRRAMTRCSHIVFPTMVFLVFMAPSVVDVLFSARYRASTTVFRIYLLLLPLRVANFATVFQAAGKTRLLVGRAVGGLLLNVVLTIVLVQRIGYLGACIATCLSAYLWVAPYSLVLSARILDTRIVSLVPWSSLLKMAVLSLLPAAIFLLPVGLFQGSHLGRLIVLAPPYALAVLLLMQLTGDIRLQEQWRRLVSRRQS